MSSHDYHLASEPDLKPSASRHVWYYFIILGVLLFIMIYALDIFYRFTLSDEKEVKIGEVMTREALDKKAMSEAYLSGKRGIFLDKDHVAISVAMSKLIHDIRNAHTRETP